MAVKTKHPHTDPMGIASPPCHLGCLGAAVVVLMLWVATLFQPEPGHEGMALFALGYG